MAPKGMVVLNRKASPPLGCKPTVDRPWGEAAVSMARLEVSGGGRRRYSWRVLLIFWDRLASN